MKVFALTLLSLLAVSQARLDYRLQCTRDEIGIRWPSYHSNSEYYVCQGVYGSQLTVHCPPGEVFTFVLQQCSSPALYVPAPPMDVLPTAAPITTHLIEDAPPVIGVVGHEHQEPQHHDSEHSAVIHPIPPTPAPAPPTPPTVVSGPAKPVPPPKPASKKPTAPKSSNAKKPSPPVPAKAAKKPTPPSKSQKKNASSA